MSLLDQVKDSASIQLQKAKDLITSLEQTAASYPAEEQILKPKLQACADALKAPVAELEAAMPAFVESAQLASM